MDGSGCTSVNISEVIIASIMDLDSFLDSVGLTHLSQRMSDENVTFDILLQANDAELSDLTTKLSDKIKLRTSLEKIRLQSSLSPSTHTDGYSRRSSVGLESPVSVALPFRQSAIILGTEGTLEGTPFDTNPPQQATQQSSNTLVKAVQATPVIRDNTNQEGPSEPKDLSFSLENCDELEFLNDIDISTLEDQISECPLHSLLSKHTRGKLLIEKSKTGQTLTSRDRCYIVSLIVETELQLLERLNQTIRKDVWQKWTNEIATLFKGESRSLYYVPYHIVEGKVIQASGLIHNRLITHRRTLTPKSTTKRRKGNSDSTCSSKSSDSSSEANNKRLRPLPDGFDDVTGHKPQSSSEESLDWLRGSSSPSELLKTKWQATFDLRTKILKDVSYNEYFNTFPGLKLPNGYELLTADFDAVYPSANNTYMERFPLVKLKLLKLLAERGESSKCDETTLELLELASVGEEQSSLAALLGIVTLLRQMHTVTVAKKKLWRLTREETRSGFLARVASASEIATYCAQREALNISRGVPNQPYILAVGPSWTNIGIYEIVTTAGGLRYQVPTICAAIKLTYNLYWALDCAYPKVAAPCWMFIQHAIFQMKSKFDVDGVPLRELLSRLNSVN